MTTLDHQTILDIQILLTKVRKKLIEADNGGGSKMFNAISEEYGPVAHHLYLSLDTPYRSIEKYHDATSRRVMLDPHTVINRARFFKDSEITIEDEEFWKHGDMIKALCDYIDLNPDYKNFNKTNAEQKKPKPKYIKLTKEYYDQDFAGRHTTLQPGCFGSLVDEEDIDTIFDITPKQKEHCLEMLNVAKNHNRHLALVAGYVCTLTQDEFIKFDAPKTAFVPWEII